MHDVATLERRGVRSVAVASEEFVAQGVYQGDLGVVQILTGEQFQARVPMMHAG